MLSDRGVVHSAAGSPAGNRNFAELPHWQDEGSSLSFFRIPNSDSVSLSTNSYGLLSDQSNQDSIADAASYTLNPPLEVLGVPTLSPQLSCPAAGVHPWPASHSNRFWAGFELGSPPPPISTAHAVEHASCLSPKWAGSAAAVYTSSYGRAAFPDTPVVAAGGAIAHLPFSFSFSDSGWTLSDSEPPWISRPQPGPGAATGTSANDPFHDDWAHWPAE